MTLDGKSRIDARSAHRFRLAREAIHGLMTASPASASTTVKRLIIIVIKLYVVWSGVYLISDMEILTVSP